MRPETKKKRQNGQKEICSLCETYEPREKPLKEPLDVIEGNCLAISRRVKWNDKPHSRHCFYKKEEKPYPTGLEQCDNCSNTEGVQCVTVSRSEDCTVNYCLCPECAKLPHSELGKMPEEELRYMEAIPTKDEQEV